jgi:cell division protein FtsL
MSDVTPDRVELSEHKTHNKVLLAVVAFLALVLQGFFTYNITSASTEMRETNRNLVEVNASIRVVQTRQDYQQTQISDLKKKDEQHDLVQKGQEARMQAVEQSIALHNQWIQSHNQ